MGKKASYTMEELNAIHAEMVTNKWSVQETATNNSVKKFDKWQTLYMAFRRNSMATNVKKDANLVTTA